MNATSSSIPNRFFDNINFELFLKYFSLKIFEKKGCFAFNLLIIFELVAPTLKPIVFQQRLSSALILIFSINLSLVIMLFGNLSINLLFFLAFERRFANLLALFISLLIWPILHNYFKYFFSIPAPTVYFGSTKFPSLTFPT